MKHLAVVASLHPSPEADLVEDSQQDLVVGPAQDVHADRHCAGQQASYGMGRLGFMSSHSVLGCDLHPVVEQGLIWGSAFHRFLLRVTGAASLAYQPQRSHSYMSRLT